MRAPMYYINIQTIKNIGSEEFARSLLTDWCGHRNSLLRPEYYGSGEPIRRKLREDGVEGAISLWLKYKSPVMLRRASRPRFTANMDWSERVGLNPNRFPWGCRVYLAMNAGDELAVELFRFVVENFDPAFGYLTTVKDLDQKHFVFLKEELGSTEFYVGQTAGGRCRRDDFCAMFPGLYWVTYFSKWAMSEIGQERLDRLKFFQSEPIGDGRLVRLYRDSGLIGTPSGRMKENEIIDALGKSLFFDKRNYSEADFWKIVHLGG